MTNGKLTLVDFSAEWCGPCKAQEPILEELQEEYGDIIEIRKVDVDKEQELAANLNIRSIPTLVFLKEGELVDISIGLTSKEELKEKIIRNV
jgi:thioredoxin 1